MRQNVLAIAAGVLAANLFMAEAVSAQQVGIAPGSRVRVSTTSLVAPLVANFLEQRRDTLVFIEEGAGPGIWSFHLDQIQRLETTAGESARSSSAVAKGAAIGGGLGFAAGALFASTVRPSDTGRTYDRLATGAIGAVVGAGIGAFIGYRGKTERWVTVPLPGQLTVVPDFRGGLRIAFTSR